jgi:hypothetical protein
MKLNDKTQAHQPSSAEVSSLDRRYRKIGIPAVAAAVRYQSDSKNPVYAPTTSKQDIFETDGYFVPDAAA